MAKSLYLVLGVETNASPQQVQSAYRHWSSRLDPEHEDADAPALREAQDAYSILADPAQRRAYDGRIQSPSKTRAEPFRPKPSPPAPIEFSLRESPAEVRPSFEELFERLWSNFALLTRPKAERLESLILDIPLTRDEAASGGRARIKIPARARCPACHGHGMLGLYECWRCLGHGAITADYPLELRYPAGILNQYIVRVALDRFGIKNLYLTVRFRVSGM